MPLSQHLTVSQKIFFSFALTALLLTSGLGYSLWLQHQQLQQVETLVQQTFKQHRALLAFGDILSAQHRLESQYGLTGETALLELQYHRRNRFLELRQTLAPVADHLSALPDYRLAVDQGLALQRDGEIRAWQAHAENHVQPLRRTLEQQVGQLRQHLEQTIEASSDRLQQDFRHNLGRALGWSALSLMLGLALMAPVLLHIYRALSTLTAQTQLYAKGRFVRENALSTNDEFAQLQRAMEQMGAELEELHQQQLDANPLTHLPGNRAIQQEIDRRFRRGENFAHVYIDLDDFKAYNDRYGYQAGSAVIAETAMVLRQAADEFGDRGTFIGHIGGDDYVAILSPAAGENVAAQVIREFDRRAPWFYEEADRRAGFIEAQDRFGVERRFPLMTLSIAVVLSEALPSRSSEAISQECARIKHCLKQLPGSNMANNAT